MSPQVVAVALAVALTYFAAESVITGTKAVVHGAKHVAAKVFHRHAKDDAPAATH
jgi:hypothetical protein